MEAHLYKVDGSVVPILPLNGTFFTLAEMQQYVEGYVEVIPLPDNNIMLVNEEGHRMRLPANLNATNVLKGFVRPSITLVGNIVVCNREMLR